MKKLILILLLLLEVDLTFGICAYEGFEYYPKTKEISLNPMFIIQGYDYSQKVILSFKNQKVYLLSENGEEVVLNLQEILKGDYYLTQAIFKPAKELKSNTKYYLKYESLIKDSTRWNSDMRDEWENLYWQTADKKTVPPLNPNLEITFKETEYQEYGCGDASWAIFNLKNTWKEEIWCKTELIDKETNVKTVFYISAEKDKIRVGNDMCSGAFNFVPKRKYKVRFTPMNTDGKVLKTTKWFHFTAHTDEL